MSDKIRLVLFSKCNRSCTGCCNQDWDVDNLPRATVEHYRKAKTVMLTGGEPMLEPELVMKTAQQIRSINNDVKIILYTAKSRRLLDLIAVMHCLDGLTLTLHEPYDVPAFQALQDMLRWINTVNYTLRLNVFSNVSLNNVNTTGWNVKAGIEWIPNCPLPPGEVLLRL